jgi:sorbitol-specific phosphotransferase system component IIA
VRILFDQGTPAPIRNYLAGHEVSTATEMGWSTLSNGELLDAAEKEFDVLITTDQALKSQQDLSHYKLAIVVLPFAVGQNSNRTRTESRRESDRFDAANIAKLKSSN